MKKLLPQNNYLIFCGKFFDGIKEEILDDITIYVKDGLIFDVGRNIEPIEGVQIINLSEFLVTPGLIDAHIHPEFFDWETLYKDYVNFSDEWISLATLRTAQKTLERGFTTIRVMGSLSRGYGLIDVREAINMNYFKGSRLIVSPHSYSCTGGHGDLSQLVNRNAKVSEILTSPSIGSGVEFFIQATRNDIKYGADFIKIIVSGGFSTPYDTPYEQQLNDNELIGIINTAKDRNIPVTAHAYTSNIIKRLVSYGVSGIEHGSFIDDETAELMEKNNVYLVPTFCPFDSILNLNQDELLKTPSGFKEKLFIYSEELKKGRATIIRSGIKLGYGSDFVSMYNNYESWREFESWVNSGINPIKVLMAATSTNAEIVGNHEIGMIKKNKRADLAAWPKGLITSPKLLEECAFVMKDGVIYVDTVNDSNQK